MENVESTVRHQQVGLRYQSHGNTEAHPTNKHPISALDLRTSVSISPDVCIYC
jgi:hypothetical protein